MKEEVLALLKSHEEDFISGQKISEQLGVSRAAIWKYIRQLEEEGYLIEAVSRKGYRLKAAPDLLNFQEIEPYLQTKRIGRRIVSLETIDSTNKKAKELGTEGVEEGTVVISEEQTQGRGRLGRNWNSPKYKGVWMSIILRPQINPIHASKITLIGAAAVTKAMEELGIKPYIKWPNDIVLDNKKVCGILTEMSAELDRINYIVMGIGINVNIEKEEFPEEIQSIATSLKIHTGEEILRKVLVGKILTHLEILYEEFLQEKAEKTYIDICKTHSILLGREIKIVNGGTELLAKAIDMDSEGELIVEYKDGRREKLISGEVSVRGLYGYV